MPGTARERLSPAYVDQVEQLCGAPFFADAERADTLRNNPNALSPADLQERTLLYTAGLRILAEQRRYGNTPEQETRARFIGQQLLLINGVEQYGPDAPTHLRPHQRPITNFMLNMLLKRPEPEQLTKTAREGHTIEDLFTKGGIFVSATGTGKTVQARAVFTQLGIDSEENLSRPEPLWGLLVVSSRDAVQQFTGLSGDDTFRRFGPEVPITPFFEDIQDVSGLIVITTRQTFVQQFRNNAFAGRQMPAVLVLDEAHRATEPLMRATLTNHYRGPVIGFTATPAYHPGKDAEKILPYVIRRGSLLSDTRDGILNGAQLFTFMIDPRLNETLAATVNLKDRRIFDQAASHLLDKAVVDYVSDRVTTGRRGIIYCDRGDGSAHAQELALVLSGKRVTFPDGTTKSIVAKAIGKFQSSGLNDRAIREYHAGRVHVLATVDKATESFNGMVDFIAFATRTTSLLRLRQMVGRGTRPSETFPITEYAEFIFPPIDSYDKEYVTIWDAFGLSQVHQGMVIIKKGKDSISEPLDAHALKLAIQGLKKEVPVLSAEDLPLQLQEYSQNAIRQIREVTIANGVKLAAPEGYIPLYAITKALERGEAHIKTVLRDFPFYGIWEDTPDGDEKLIRYYPPEALEYLLVTRQVEIKPSSESFSAHRISKEVGCSIGFAERAIELGTALGLPGFEPKLGPKTNAGKPLLQYGPDVLAFVEKKYAEIPPPQSGERTVSQLWAELGTGKMYVRKKVHAFGIKIEPRRKPDNYLGAYLTYEDVECIRADFYSVPLAAADEFDLSEVLEFARMGYALDCFTPKELARAKTRRPIGAPGATRSMLPLDVTLNFIRANLPTSLPVHLVPRQIIIATVNKSAVMIDKVLREYGEPIKLKLPNIQGGPASCYPWEALFVVAKAFSFKDGIPRFSYHQFPQSAEDVPAKCDFARKIQELYLSSNTLVKVPMYEEVEKELREVIAQREKRRLVYLSQYDRAARWGIVMEGEVTSEPPHHADPSGVTPKSTTVSRRGSTCEEIAKRAGVPLEAVEGVLAKLAAEYKTDQTVEECIEANGLKKKVYKGKYLDAALMTLIGRTPERIAEIAGMPVDAVLHYLANNYRANDKGRYDLKALIGVLAKFRRPPSRGYRTLEEVATEMSIPVPTITDILKRYGGTVESFYDQKGEKREYVSSFSEQLAKLNLTPTHATPPPAINGFYNRFELLRSHPQLSPARIDKYLRMPVLLEKALWLKVRNPEAAAGAYVLPHYPIEAFKKTLTTLAEW